MSARKLAVALGGGRIAFAAALFVAPGPTAAGWLGAGGDTAGGRVATRALGFRDGAIAAGIIVAALRGGAVRPWLLACVASDLADITATLIDRAGLPDHAAAKTVAVAGATAAAGLALTASVDR